MRVPALYDVQGNLPALEAVLEEVGRERVGAIVSGGDLAAGLAVEILGPVDAAVVVCGHTHMQFDRRVGGVRVVNAGSVGMPYEAEPGAYWSLLGPDVVLRHTSYDADAAAVGIRATGWPDADPFVRENVLTAPSRAEALAAFEPRVGGA